MSNTLSREPSSASPRSATPAHRNLCRQATSWRVLLLALLLFASGVAVAVEAVGEVTRQRGTASAELDGQRRDLAVTSPVHVGETVTTGPGARLRLQFADGSALTLGAEASVVIEALDQGAGDAVGRQWLGVLAGTFRFVTGAIGKREPNAVELRTPVATIGIRGTELFGGPLAAGMPPGELHYGFQLFEGRVEVLTPHGSVTLDEPGEGTFLPMDGGEAPTPPTGWGPEATLEAERSLAF